MKCLPLRMISALCGKLWKQLAFPWWKRRLPWFHRLMCSSPMKKISRICRKPLTSWMTTTTSQTYGTTGRNKIHIYCKEYLHNQNGGIFMSGTRNEEEKQRLDKEDQKNDQIREMGQVILDKNEGKRRVELLTIIGEVEGHESAPSQSKTTKYEHVL